MNIKKTVASFLAAAMVLVTASGVAVTSSAATLVPSENPGPGLSSAESLWFLTIYNSSGSLNINYNIDYSKVSKFSVTFTVAEEDRDQWSGRVGGTLVMLADSDDFPEYETDENGDTVYETDENGDIVYKTDYETGEFLLDENGNKIPKEKTHPLREKYGAQFQGYWGLTDEELGLDTASGSDSLSAEKVGDYTYKVTSEVFANPLANGDAQSINNMQLWFIDWSGSEERIRITNVDVMDSSDNVLISFDGDGKTNTDNTAATGALETVKDPAATLIETNSEHWYVLGYETRKLFEQNPEVKFDIDYSKIAKLSATLTVVEEDRDIFDGQCAGALALLILNEDIQVDKQLWDKYFWQGHEWWGVKDDALGIDTQATEKDIVSEKVGDYTYKITSKVFDNPLANGDTQEIEHMMFAVQEWGFNKAKMRVVQLDVLDSSDNVLLSYDANGNGTIPVDPEPDADKPIEPLPDTSEPDTSDSPSTPDTSDASSEPEDTSSTPAGTVEFVPSPVVDETLDEETAQVISEIKVYAPETAFEAGTTLTVKKDDSIDGENLFALDITFTLNGSSVQPKDGASVTVSVPVPPKFKNVSENLLKVYHFINGRYTKVEATVSNGMVTFETTHFSTYVISPDDLDIGNSAESGTSVPETPDVSNSNPETGIAISALPIVMALSAVIAIKKKK
ncbi:MAG: hypothetical protein K2N38_07000 [Oscillospiraceae bacterium]|nr:hypothetical protein [Oscillospiraceae bacterium]